MNADKHVASRFEENNFPGYATVVGLVPWSKQNNQFTMKAANWLRRFGIPELRKRINATNKSN